MKVLVFVDLPISHFSLVFKVFVVVWIWNENKEKRECRNIKLPNIITEGFETRIFGKDNLLFEKGQTVTFEFEFTFQYNYISANNHNLDNRNEISRFAPYFVFILNFELPHDFAGKISKLICKLLMAWKKLSEESTQSFLDDFLI